MEEVMIRWETMPAAEIHALVCATNPWNKGAYTTIGGMSLRILETNDAGEAPAGARPGQILAADLQQGLFAASMDGRVIEIRIVYTDLGFNTGARLVAMGIVVNMEFR
jgi:methionyl-tRNA formyltransferase